MLKTPNETIFELASIGDDGFLLDVFQADKRIENTNGDIISNVPTFEIIPTLESSDVEQDTQDEAINFCV